MSLNAFNSMKVIQKNKCGGCGEEFGEKMDAPVIHHNHFTDHVDALWHGGCNLAEGLLKTARRAQRVAKAMDEHSLFEKRSAA